MFLEKTKEERKKVSLNKETCKKLNTFSRQNALKLRWIVDSMVDIVLNDATLTNRVIDLAAKKQATEEE